MNCSCCGKKRRLFESFTRVEDGNYRFDICGRCGDILYAIKGAKAEGATSVFSELTAQIESRMKKGSSSDFSQWYRDMYSQSDHKN